MRTISRLGATLIVLALAAGCSTDKPSTPTAPPAQPVTPAPAATSVSLAITVNPSQIEAGSTDPAVVTVTGQRNDTGGPLPERSKVTLTTTLGAFGSQGGGTSVVLELLSGSAQVVLFPGAAIGTASLRAEYDPAAQTTLSGLAAGVASGTLRIVEETPFVVTSVSPNLGTPDGGETVQVFGGGFEQPVRVFFDGDLAAVVQSVSSTRITVTAPRLPDSRRPATGTVRTVSVTVNNAFGTPRAASDTLPNSYNYAFNSGILQPTILSVTPASGPNEGGTEVVITGDGFESPLKVEFGKGTAALPWVEAQVTSVSRTRLVVRSPAATGFGQGNLNALVDIKVTNLSSGRNGSLVNAFKYGVSVIITSLGPGQGPYFGGTLVTINGQGFDEPVAVGLANVAQQVISVSGTQIVVRTVPVQVTNCVVTGATNTAPSRVTNIETGDSATGPTFSYTVLRPIVFGVSPSGGPQSGGTSVTISGSQFRSPVAVEFVKGDVWAAPVQGLSGCDSDGYCTTVTVTSPSVPNSTLDDEDCDDNGDGTQGTRYLATPFSIRVRNLETGCTSDSFANGYTYQPSDNSCRNDSAPATATPAPTPPVASFTHFVVSGFTVQFNNTSTGNPTTYEWDFTNDGSIDSTAQSPQHTFPGVGTYGTRLRVTNAGGSSEVVNSVVLTP